MKIFNKSFIVSKTNKSDYFENNQCIHFFWCLCNNVKTIIIKDNQIES